jgi:hypothetical protein
METNATLEVNGKHYDMLVGSVSAPSLRTSPQNIDGFFRARTRARRIIPHSKLPINSSVSSLPATTRLVPSAPEIHNPLHATRAVNHTRAHTPQNSRSRVISVDQTTTRTQRLTVHRGQPNHARYRTTQHSQTLRRDAVRTPEQSTHNRLRPSGALQAKVPSDISFKRSAEHIDSDRLIRASSVPKSPLVIHHSTKTAPIVPTLTALTVQPAPSPAVPPIVPPPIPGNDGVPPAPAPAPLPDNKPTDIFEHALANANNFVDLKAHKASYHKKAKTHIASMAIGSLALIVAATFVLYQSSPLLQVKVASVKAGISAHMPDFAAAGFIYNGVRAADDRIIFGFKSQNKSYELTQTSTNFNDADMIQTIGAVNPNGTPIYQVVMAGNTVVYRFNNTNATWVADGNWYTVSGNGALTNQQVAAIVQHV